MSVALADHTGPWTADDVEALPDAGDHARFEVYEGGVLVVSPAPGVGHQRASYWLHHALAQAALAAGADAEVLEAVNVALPGGKLLVPDVVVVAAGAVGETTTRIPCDAVLAVVEVVSPSTTAIEPGGQAGHVRGDRNPRLLAGGVAGHAEGRRVLSEPWPVCHPDHAGRRHPGPDHPALRGRVGSSRPHPPHHLNRGAQAGRSLLLIWCSATSRAHAPHRIDSPKRATSIGGITSSDAGAGENTRRAVVISSPFFGVFAVTAEGFSRRR